ncbi:hypothetical protein [Streptomyces sp. DH8]|uniref:hypothetical protein n=1 Tax=Streptomyces sp. DH8 TaxID=2857008 RepID=UPI001E3D225C|nr:hypothetical protein [Streptomyces sp. DH8]
MTTQPRELNACGFSPETIAAEYETDQALREAHNDLDNPYFKAAWAAEREHRQADWDQTAATKE